MGSSNIISSIENDANGTSNFMFLHLKIISCCWFTKYWLLTKICCWFVVVSLDLGFEARVRGWDSSNISAGSHDWDLSNISAGSRLHDWGFTGILLLHGRGSPTGERLHDRRSSRQEVVARSREASSRQGVCWSSRRGCFFTAGGCQEVSDFTAR